MLRSKSKHEVSYPRNPTFRTERTPGVVELGIHDQSAAPGDHIAYFWETDKEFTEAVKFLKVGLRNGDYCINFGHDDANARVREILASDFDVDELERTLQLTMLPGHRDAKEMLHSIGESFAAAQQRGSKMLRLLGNIGWGRADWPDEDAILEFEAAVTTAIKTLPAVVVCMYDARNVPGRAMFRGAFETHPLTICRNVVRENPHYVEAGEFIAALRSAR
jgi:hypothetical protein